MDFVVIRDIALPVKIALTEKEQELGLMFEPWPPPIMAFPYEKAAIRKFWMKNTISPLDIVFCRSGSVIDIVAGEPWSEQHIGPEIESDLIVEFPLGSAAKLAIEPGNQISVRYGLETLARKFELLRKIS